MFLFLRNFGGYLTTQHAAAPRRRPAPGGGPEAALAGGGAPQSLATRPRATTLAQFCTSLTSLARDFFYVFRSLSLALYLSRLGVIFGYQVLFSLLRSLRRFKNSSSRRIRFNI